MNTHAWLNCLNHCYYYQYFADMPYEHLSEYSDTVGQYAIVHSHTHTRTNTHTWRVTAVPLP